MSLIQLTSVNKTFGFGDTAVQALIDVELTIERGEFIVIMGPSGSGKTTMMNILGLLDRVDTGEYLFKGEEVTAAGRRERARLRRNSVGFIFQAFNLLPRLTALENVALPLTYRGVKHTEKLEMAAESLAEVGLEDKQYYYPHELSGGQHQRVAIARAIVGEPDIILADEPTGNLDSGTSKLVMGMLKRLHGQGHTVIMVTHNAELIEYGDRVVFMKDGKIDSISEVKDLTKKDIREAKKEQEQAAQEEIKGVVEATKLEKEKPKRKRKTPARKKAAEKRSKVKKTAASATKKSSPKKKGASKAASKQKATSKRKAQK